MAALAPYTGQRARHRAHRLARASASRRRRSRWSRALPRARASGSACSPSTRRRRSPAARCSATGSGCRTTRLDPGVYIRSMATPRPPRRPVAGRRPQALRVLDAAGCDVVLVETVGVGQSEVEVAGARRHHGRAARARAWATAIQAAKAGILEIGDVFVVNKADRDGADADRPRPAAHARPRRAHGAGRLAAAGRQDRRRRAARASTRSSRRSTSTGVAGGDRRAAAERRRRRAADEMRPSRSPRFASGWATCGRGDRARRAGRRVVAGRTDPYAAADQLLAGLAEGQASAGRRRRGGGRGHRRGRRLARCRPRGGGGR